jgi:hypothetical protein
MFVFFFFSHAHHFVFALFSFVYVLPPQSHKKVGATGHRTDWEEGGVWCQPNQTKDLMWPGSLSAATISPSRTTFSFLMFQFGLRRTTSNFI